LEPRQMLAANQPIDILLLFDDTGSFSDASNTLTGAFSSLIDKLSTSLPGADVAIGMARFEDYGGSFSFAGGADRPFILNQPILSVSDAEFQSAMKNALARSAPGGGVDLPESDIEALFQAATGFGFDGNNNGTTTDSGAAGLVTTQTDSGGSGDVPAFGTFTADPQGPVIAGPGTIGGVGFRPGALHLILLATDDGFAYQPDNLDVYTGKDGVTVPASDVTGIINGVPQFDGRGETPDGRGASIQETINALVNLDGGNGAQVIGLGTNSDATNVPRRPLEAIAKLTGAVNKTGQPIDGGIDGDPIEPGEPLYFLIDTDTASTIVNAIGLAVGAAADGSTDHAAIAALSGRVGPAATAHSTLTVTQPTTVSAAAFDSSTLLLLKKGRSGESQLPVMPIYQGGWETGPRANGSQTPLSEAQAIELAFGQNDTSEHFLLAEFLDSVDPEMLIVDLGDEPPTRLSAEAGAAANHKANEKIKVPAENKFGKGRAEIASHRGARSVTAMKPPIGGDAATNGDGKDSRLTTTMVHHWTWLAGILAVFMLGGGAWKGRSHWTRLARKLRWR
ncbi:MAG TPA: hypothetical protein VFW73_06535, partial [Lacipirellulaceae bacterium]|nr:hypothetical protein [Lacipirellulaceae bacterium]